MRVRHWLLVGSISVGLAGVLASGCGGSSDDTTPQADAGGNDGTTADVANDQSSGGQDVAADTAKESGSSCVEDASIATLSPPDASLADGASSVGLCLGCVKSSCSAELNACAGDCQCNNAIEQILPCVLGGGALLTCGAPLLALPQSSQQLGIALATCLNQNCASACIPQIDAGPKDSGSDAANDAPDAD